MGTSDLEDGFGLSLLRRYEKGSLEGEVHPEIHCGPLEK